MPFPFCSKTSISHHHNSLPPEGPNVWCVVPGSSPPLHFGEGWWQGCRWDKNSYAGFQHPGEPQAAEKKEGGRLKMEKSSHCGLYAASLVLRKGREEAVWEKQSKILGALCYNIVWEQEKTVFFDRKSPSSTFTVRFLGAQPEWNLVKWKSKAYALS